MSFNVNDFNFAELFSQGQEFIALYGLKVIGAIAIFFIGRIVARVVARAVKAGMDKRGLDTTISAFTHNLLYAGLIAFVIIAALGQIGIQTASFIAILGAAGLAVGLALQGSLSNFAAGVLMIIFKPFKVGDYVEAGDASGSIEEVHIFYTIMATPDNKTIIIPNSAIMGGNITNYSMKDTRRVDLVIGISYDADLHHAKTVLNDVVAKEARVLKDAGNMIAVAELADSSVNFVVRSWVKTGDYWPVHFDLLEAIKIRLDEEGIGIPYPQLDLHVANADVFQSTSKV